MAKLTVLPKRLNILDAAELSCEFRINNDVLKEAFGIGRSMFAKACYPERKHDSFPGTKPGDHYIFWMPKLYSNNSEWKNTLYKGGLEIHEDAEPTRHEDWIEIRKHDLSVLRLVFVIYKNVQRNEIHALLTKNRLGGLNRP